MGLMVWSPLAGGLPSGKYARDEAATEGRRAGFDFPRSTAGVRLHRRHRAHGQGRRVSVAQIARAWLLHQKVVSSVSIGAKRLDQLEDNIAATAVELTAGELDMLGQVSARPREYPGWMFEAQGTWAKQLAEAGAARRAELKGAGPGGMGRPMAAERRPRHGHGT